jgi:hypothetical protein
MNIYEWISMTEDMYFQMRQEIASLWETLRNSPKHRRKNCRKEIFNKFSIVNALAVKIGGSVLRDCNRLKLDIDRFLLEELKSPEIYKMFQNALRLEQDTREL